MNFTRLLNYVWKNPTNFVIKYEKTKEKKSQKIRNDSLKSRLKKNMKEWENTMFI